MSEYKDFEWNVFIKILFSEPPYERNYYRMDIMNSNKSTNDILIDLLSRGTGILFNKPLTALNEIERETMLKYFHSIGYDIKYTITETNGGEYVNISFSLLPLSF